MNPNDFPNNEDRWIDLLVDGELDPTRRREFLLRLESAPDGWRRCALAFLESQAWRDAFSAGSSSARGSTEKTQALPALALTDPEPTEHPIIPKQPNGRETKGSVLYSLSSVSAFAAGLLFAFVLGRVSAGTTGLAPERSTRPSAIAQDATGSQRPALDPNHTDRPTKSSEDRRVSRIDRDEFTIAPTAAPALVAQTGLGLDPAWASSPATPLPPIVRQEATRSGYELEQHTRLVPVRLSDGRRVQLPVEETTIRYVGNRTF
jgi:hypothetical protein